MRIVVFSKYGDLAASTRQRFIQYQRFGLAAGLELFISPLLDNGYLNDLFKSNRKPLSKAVWSYLSRATGIMRAADYDGVIVHCELFPFLPHFAETMIFRAGKPVVFDFDDAIFHQYDQHPNPLVRRFLGRKLEPLLRGAALAVCGNAYLESYAARFCSRAEVVPTVVDTSLYIPSARKEEARPITLGWIGSPSTWRFVKPIVPLLQSLAKEMGLIIRLVGARPQHGFASHFEFLDWSEATEIEMIQTMDIGIMPLPDEPWARGKCGYKLVQYMACGLPVIASPVGVNSTIIDHGVNGLLARSERDWVAAIRRLAFD